MAFRRLGDLVGRYLGIGGATGDASNPLSVRGAGALFDGDSGGHQVRINKSGVSDTASFLFQRGFSGRAEFGLIGNDNFELKVSADGSVFNQAFVVDDGTAVTDFKQQPTYLGQNLYHTGNFTPSNYAALSGATFTGNVQAVDITATGHMDADYFQAIGGINGGIRWEDGVCRLVTNDGGGNAHMYWGAEFNGGHVFTHGGGAVWWTAGIDSTADNIALETRISTNGGAGTGQGVTWGKVLRQTSSELLWDGNAVWDAGNLAAPAVTDGNNNFGSNLQHMYRGILGGYLDGNGGQGDWGVPIWSMGDAYMGTGTGDAFTPGTYSLTWLRTGNASSDNSNVGEGLYAYRAGSLVAGIGHSGTYLPAKLKVDGVTTLGQLGVGGATPDATNKFAFYGTDLLLNSGGSINMKYNKNAAGNDASMTFQTGFTTYGLLGLLGNNDFTLKVGTGFTTALIADNTDGTVSFPEGVRHDTVTAYKTTSQTLTGTGTWDDITSWTGTHIAASGNLSWTASTGQAFVGKTGRFLVSYSLSTEISTGFARSDSLAKLQKWNGSAWVDVEGTEHRMYNRISGRGGSNASWSGVLDLTGSEGLKVVATVETGTDTIIVDQVSLSISRM